MLKFRWKGILLFIYLLWVQLIDSAKHFTGYIHHGSEDRNCYSCMSEEFEKHWSYLEKVYYRPLNFTDHCHTMPNYARIGIQECPHSLCVTVVEPKILAGQHIGSNVIRGCFSSVFRHGDVLMGNVNKHNVLDTRCNNISAKKLLPPHLAKMSSNRMVDVCWCVGQLCNDYPSINGGNNRKNMFKIPKSQYYFRNILKLFFTELSLFINVFVLLINYY
uniref:Caenorhabditis elegans ly-6-related family-containing protein n=1 Tax=Parastrongyloides trichosuri TaxID=131310 RepID=A0A0N4ZB44_PARTI